MFQNSNTIYQPIVLFYVYITSQILIYELSNIIIVLTFINTDLIISLDCIMYDQGRLIYFVSGDIQIFQDFRFEI